MGRSARSRNASLMVISGVRSLRHRYNFSMVFRFMCGHSLHEQPPSPGATINVLPGRLLHLVEKAAFGGNDELSCRTILRVPEDAGG